MLRRDVKCIVIEGGAIILKYKITTICWFRFPFILKNSRNNTELRQRFLIIHFSVNSKLNARLTLRLILDVFIVNTFQNNLIF